jgi:hypothetical protein
MVKVDESSHYQLAIHAITYSTMPRNNISEILNMQSNTLIFIDLFSPEPKKPPNGPIILANKEKIIK